MESPENEEPDGFDWRSVDWKLWLSRVLIAGIALWVVAGVVRIILQDFYVEAAGYLISPNEFTARSIVHATTWALVIESIAFRVWLASAILWGFLWMRDRAVPN